MNAVDYLRYRGNDICRDSSHRRYIDYFRRHVLHGLSRRTDRYNYDPASSLIPPDGWSAIMLFVLP